MHWINISWVCVMVISTVVVLTSSRAIQNKIVKRNTDGIVDFMMDEEPALQRVKRGDPEVVREKRDAEPELIRVKRKDVIDQSQLVRVKREDSEPETELKRYKRFKKDVGDEEELHRYKRAKRGATEEDDDDVTHTEINGRPLSQRAKRVLNNKSNRHRSFLHKLMMRRKKRRHSQDGKNGHVVKRVLGEKSRKNRKKSNGSKISSIPREKKDGRKPRQRNNAQQKAKRNMDRLNRLHRDIKAKLNTRTHEQ